MQALRPRRSPKTKKPRIAAGSLNGGAEGDRTPDLCNAIAALSQLSYGPEPFRALPMGPEEALWRRP